MGDACVNSLPTLAFDPLLQMSVWAQKPMCKGFYQKHDVFSENTMFSENREKHDVLVRVRHFYDFYRFLKP